MIIKNRKLVRRDNLGKIADYIDLDRLKADAEAAMLEIPTDFWYGNANEADSVDNLFVWLLTDKTPHPLAFWKRVHKYFTVEPLPTDLTANIKSATKSWKGVDTDEFIKEMRSD